MKGNVLQYLSLFSQFFLNMVVPIAGCSYFGWWLDQKLDTSFWVIIMFFVGALAGMTSVMKLANKMTKKSTKK